MGGEYRLQEYKTPDGNSFWELVGPGNDAGDFSKMMSAPRNKSAAINLVRHVDKIAAYGVRTSCATNKLRLLDAKLGLYELKGYDGVNREMSYILVKDPPEIVFLFSFKGHQGKGGNIHKEIKRGRPLAKIASQLLEDMYTNQT